jgi:hypothetical protein
VDVYRESASSKTEGECACVYYVVVVGKEGKGSNGCRRQERAGLNTDGCVMCLGDRQLVRVPVACVHNQALDSGITAQRYYADSAVRCCEVS